jgi:hypothetical protein
MLSALPAVAGYVAVDHVGAPAPADCKICPIDPAAEIANVEAPEYTTPPFTAVRAAFVPPLAKLSVPEIVASVVVATHDGIPLSRPSTKPSVPAVVVARIPVPFP